MWLFFVTFICQFLKHVIYTTHWDHKNCFVLCGLPSDPTHGEAVLAQRKILHYANVVLSLRKGRRLVRLNENKTKICTDACALRHSYKLYSFMVAATCPLSLPYPDCPICFYFPLKGKSSNVNASTISHRVGSSGDEFVLTPTISWCCLGENEPEGKDKGEAGYKNK